jgi:NADH-quinone oxidoreductase subunit N
VYEGAPATITAFFLMPVKAGALIALMRLLYAALIGLASYWLGILVWVSVCSISWGAFAALVECKISRFLGYASINQVGYLLLGSACESDLGILSVNSYLVAYLVMSAGFLLIYIHGRRKGTEKLYYISDFRGFGVQERAMA